MSLSRNTCAHILNETVFISLHPSKSKAEAGNFLDNFIDDIGIPMNVRFDHAVEFLGEVTEFMNIIKKPSINWGITEPYSHW